MKWKSRLNLITKRGMTLAEVVIAIAIIASTVPLILAATSSAQRSRQAAETDTRSAWLVRDVQRIIQNEWSKTTGNSDLETSFFFPTEASPKATMELAYKKDGTLILINGMGKPAYLVSIQAEAYQPPTNQSIGLPLALISIKIRAASHKHKELNYRYVCTRGGML